MINEFNQHFRNVLKKTIATAEAQYIQNVVKIPQSSLFVTVDHAVTYVQLAAENKREIDILQENLGKIIKKESILQILE